MNISDEFSCMSLFLMLTEHTKVISRGFDKFMAKYYPRKKNGRKRVIELYHQVRSYLSLVTQRKPVSF